MGLWWGDDSGLARQIREVFAVFLTPTEILYRACGSPAHGYPTEGVPSGRCALCGAELSRGVPVDVVIRPTFNNFDAFRCPESEHFCAACVFVLTAKEPNFRTKQKGKAGFVASPGGFFHLTGDEMAQKLFYDPLEPPFILCVPANPPAAKHLVPYARTNYSVVAIHVQFIEQPVQVVPSRDVALFEAVSRVSTVVGKPYLGKTFPRWLNKYFSQAEADHLKTLLEPLRGGALYDLLVHLAPSKNKSGGDIVE